MCYRLAFVRAPNFELRSAMPRLQVACRKRIIILRRQGYPLRIIQGKLSEEGIKVSLRSLQRLCVKFKQKHTIQDLKRKPRARLLSAEMLAIMEECLRNDDELTARRLKAKLSEKLPVDFPNVSLSSIRRNRREHGWVCTRPHYCQLIREANKIKRKEWCQQQIDNNERFHNVIFTDECTVQLDHHGRLCFRKEKEARILKQRPKHPAKIHIWGGISMRGATRIIMFTGNMNAIRYGKVVEAGLVPFIKTCFPDGHRLQQDNDPKHNSKYINRLFKFHSIFWWKTHQNHQI